MFACITGAQTCDDYTSDSLDLCNGVDDDCDPATPDGSQDPSVDAPCDGPDAGFCEEGFYQCVGGALHCTDNTGDDWEVCDDWYDNDCDGYTDCEDAECDGQSCDGGNGVCGGGECIPE